MRNLLQTLFFFLLITQVCFAQWEWQNPLPQGNNLNDVDFTDEYNGIAVGESGTIIRTTDGGVSWTRQKSGTTLSLNGIYFTDADNAWAVGGDYFFPSPFNYEGIILRTTNGGRKWLQKYFSTEYMLNGLSFIDENIGWAVGGTFDTSIVLHTTDGGTNWTEQNCGGWSMLNDICFTNLNTGTAVSNYARIFRTTDGGANWTEQTCDAWELRGVHFIDANIGWAVGGFTGYDATRNNKHLRSFDWYTSIIHTIDGGTTWTSQMDTLDALLYGISFLDSSFGFAVGRTPSYLGCSGAYSGIILRTKDGGASWIIIDAGISTGWDSGFKDFCFTNEGNGLIVGNYGVILKTSDEGTTWDSQLNGTTNDLNSLAFTDATNGFAVGNSGTILRTTNGGDSWLSQVSGTLLHLNDICFLDENNGWIVGVSKFANDWGPNDSSIILHTIDGGISWLQQKTFVGTMQLFDLFFTDSNNGWAVGAEYSGDGDGVILRTIDGGTNWEISTTQPVTWFHSIYFIDSSSGWACGHNGIIAKTTDSGLNWITQTIGSGIYRYIYFFDESNGWALGNDKLIHSTNGGNSWVTQIPYSSTNSFSSVKFFDLNNGLIISNDYSDQNSRILKTSNGGTTWFPLIVGSHRWLNEFYFEDINNGWIVGENGSILHTTNGGVSFVEEEQLSEVPTEFLLSQNYPNPFNPSTKIEYSVPQTSQVQIKVFDVLGNEIETIVNEEKPTGTYELTWNAANLPSGVYFYRIHAGDFVKTKKMILLR